MSVTLMWFYHKNAFIAEFADGTGIDGPFEIDDTNDELSIETGDIP